MSHVPRVRHRGSAYVLVLSASLLVAVIGISALMAARIQHRAAAGTDDLAEARIYARSALEIALHHINNDPTWRTTYGNSNWPKNQPIGNGTYTIEAVDPADGDVTTGNLDPIELTGIGVRGMATQKIRVRLEADAPPLAVLNTALHAETQVHVVKETVNGALIEVTGSGVLIDYYALRAKGSTQDIYREATWHPWAIVPVDANQVLEGRIEDANLDFFLVGHTLGGAKQSFTYIDPSVDVTPTAGAWTSVNVSAWVPAGATGVIVHVVGSDATGRFWGLRKPGSSDNITDMIYTQDHLWAMIGVDANRVFEAYIAATDMTLRLAGYTGAGVTFFTNAKNKSLTALNTWTDIDISADTTDTAIGAIIQIDGEFNEAFGVRMKGSTDNRIKDARHAWAVIGVDSAEVFQGNITDLSMDFYLVGYITQGAVFKTNAYDISVTIPAAPFVDIDISTLTGSVATLTAFGAPVSADVDILNEGSIYGDVEAGSAITNLGTINGTQTVPVPDKAMPASTVVNTYIGLATVIPNPGSIDKQVLSPGNNPWGATDPDGVYYIDTLGGDLRIKGSRIHGTLVVKCGTGTVRLEDAVLLHPYRSDYPTLIVDGNLELLLDSSERPLSEAEWGVNFNPGGSLYKAVSNVNESDDYPNEVQGLIHVTGNLLMSRSSRVWGAIICEDTATCLQDTAVIHDPNLYANPPLGYTESAPGPPMTIVSGTWEQVVN